MKKHIRILFLLALTLCPLLSRAQAESIVRGSVADAAAAPLGFATVFATTPSGKVAAGSSADENGRFELKLAPGTYTLTVSLIGYQDLIRPLELGAAGSSELGVLTLQEDTHMLEGASVRAVMPKTKLTGEGLQTNVRGSVLENVGTAADVLAKTPGLVKGQNGLEVIGKGAPLIYINGHKVSDSGELERLQSNEIQNVEVITNPGPQYDATVTAVVRIKTVRRQGEGFGFKFNASDEQSLQWAKGNDPKAGLDVNYRNGGVDYFGGINFDSGSFRQISQSEAVSWFDKGGVVNEFKNTGDIEAQDFARELFTNAGVNWQLSDNHFLGGKIEWGRMLRFDDETLIHLDVSENGTLVDRLSTVSTDALSSPAPFKLGANLYYNGVVRQKLGIDVNFDYYGTRNTTASAAAETSAMTTDADVHSDSRNENRLYAAKAVLSYPVWKGQLQLGTEETFSRRSDRYTISGVAIPASSASIREDNLAGFASYAFFLPHLGQISAGARYEHVNYDYRDELDPTEDRFRSYGNLFPTLSYAGALGPVQLMLNYSAKTRRPGYSQLSGAIRYNSRYIWQSGNARLQPQISHNIGLTAVWKWITFMTSYIRTDDAIMLWSEPYVKPGVADGVVLVQPRNIDTPYRKLTAFVNLTPTFGPWNLNYTLGATPQWLNLNLADPRTASGRRTVSFNGKPIFFAQFLNTLNLKGGWQLELGGLVQTRGYTENVYLKKAYCDITAAVQKTLLRDGSLVLRLEGSDLARSAVTDIDTDFGSHTISQINYMDTQRIKFSLRYSFNTVQSKYRGTGAGSDEKARMK